jgi:hypothetical protein
VLAKVFAELAGRREVWQSGLEGWNVEVSQVVLEWEAKGEARGEARGKAEGAAVLRETLITLLRNRFPQGVSEDIFAAVQGQTDLATLGRWTATAGTAAELAEVRAAFGLA